MAGLAEPSGMNHTWSGGRARAPRRHARIPGGDRGGGADNRDADIAALIAALDTDEPRRLRQAGSRVAAVGPRALPHLIRALAAGPPSARKAIAYVLRRHKRLPAAKPLGQDRS